MGKRLTDRITLHTGLQHENFDADADEFDFTNNRFYLSIDYKASPQNTVYIGLGYLDGDVASSTSDNTPASKPQGKPGIQPVRQFSHHLPSEAAASLRADDAFSNSFVYQLDASAISLRIGDNHALSSHQSIDVSVFYYDADGYSDNDYDGIIAQLSYLHRF